jgi:hypothetical protein
VRARGGVDVALRGSKRDGIADRGAEERGIVVVGDARVERTFHGRRRLGQPRPSRYFSASSAAMQPEPALVTAWR